MRLSTLLALVLVACSTDPVLAARDCTPGTATSCACLGGLVGVQTCTAAGTVGACVCPDAGSAADVVDAGSVEDRPAAIDAPRADVADADAGAGLDVVDAGGASDVLTGGDVVCTTPQGFFDRRCSSNADCDVCAARVSGHTWCCGITGYCENRRSCDADAGFRPYQPDVQIDCAPNTDAPVLVCRTHEDCARTCMALPNRVWCCSSGGECGTRTASGCSM